MAKDNVIGLAMNLDVADLKSGIREVNKLVKKASQEFDVATAGLDKWTKSSEGLNAKIKQLKSNLDAQKKAVAGYQAEIKRVSALEGDHSAQLEELQDKLAKAEITVKKTEKSINHYTKSLQDVIDEEKEAESAFGQLTDKIEKQEKELEDLQKEYQNAVLQFGKGSKESKNLAKDIKNLSADLQKNKSNIDGTKNALNQIEKKFDDAGNGADEFASGLQGIGKLSNGIVKGVGALAGALVGIGGALVGAAAGTKEYRTNIGKLETGFETTGKTAEQAKQTYKDLYSVVADEGKATEATAHIAKIAKSQEDLAKWTDICTGVYATFGDSLPIENLAEASNETAKTGKITGGLADSLNWCGISEEGFQKALDKCTTEQERQKLITETLNTVYGEASEKYKEVNKDVINSNKSQVELTDTIATLGEKTEPVLTAVKDGFNRLLEKILELVEDVDFSKIKESVDNAFTFFIDTVIPKIIDGFKWIKDNKDELIAGVIGLGTALLTLNIIKMINGVVKAFKALQVAQKGLTLGQIALNLAMKANLIGIIISAVAGLVAGFIYLWNTSDKFREFWLNLWETVKNACSVAIEAIGNFFVLCWDGIKLAWGATVEFFTNIWESVKNGFKIAIEAVGNFFSDTWTNVKNIWSNVTGFFTEIGTSIKNGFMDALNSVKNFFSDAWENVKNIWSNVADWFSNKVTEIINKFVNIPNDIKKFFSDAWNNIKEIWENPGQFFKDAVKKILDKFKTLPDDMVQIGKDMMEKLWEGIKEKYEWLKGKVEKIKDFFTFDKKVEVKASVVVEEPKIIEPKVQTKKTEPAVQKKKTVATKQEVEETKEKFANLANEPKPEKKEKKDKKPKPEKKLTFFDKFEDKLGVSAEKLKAWSESTAGNAVNKLTGYAEQAVDKVGEFVNSLNDLFAQLAENEVNALEKELQVYLENKDKESVKAEETFNDEMAKQEELVRNGIISSEEYAQTKANLENNLKEKQKQIEDEKLQKEQEVLKKKDEIARRQFEGQKATSIAMAIVNGMLAIAKGFADLGPIGGAINAGIQATLTGVQVATIASQQYVPMLAKGGVVDSPTYAMIGEDGKEAVLPLENNTGWMQEFAKKLYNIMQKDLLSGVKNNNYAYSNNNSVTNIYNTYNQTINTPKSPSRIELYRDTKNLLSLKGV